MKKIVLTIALICSMIAFPALGACTSTEQPPDAGVLLYITDFPQYKDLTDSPVKILVEYDDSAYYGEFEITQSSQIEEIVASLFQTQYRREDDIGAGGNTLIKFVDEDGNITSISLGTIRYNDVRYYPLSMETFNIVAQIARDSGVLIPR